MTRSEKAALAAMLIDAAGTLVEFWGESRPDELADVSADEAAVEFARWLRKLPGDAWHMSLPSDV